MTTSTSPHRTALSVNVNKVALVRNTRHLGIPSVVRAAELCLQAGAQGITVHPRPDERHIRAPDVFALAVLLKKWPGREYNIEGNPSHNLMEFIRQVRPQQATFVPAADCRMQGAGRARQPLHGPGARADGAGQGCGRRPR